MLRSTLAVKPLSAMSIMQRGGGVKMETEHYPMSTEKNSSLNMNDGRINRVRICGARTRAGTPCRRYDLYESGRCALHGGLSRSGREHGRYTHGKRTKEAIEERRNFTELLREARQVLTEI